MSDILETMREFAKFAETKSEREAFEAVIDEITTLRARLAPVEDERLVEIAVKKALFVMSSAHGNELERWSSAMRAAIAAIRPHIEAAQRERCAKIAELCWTGSPDEIAEEIRSEK